MVMDCRKSILSIFLLVAGTAAVFSQANSSPDAGPIRSSPAYSEVLLRKTELQANLEALAADYTDANPKIVDLRTEIAAINKLLERIFAVRPSETGKLTLALGKLIVQDATLQTDLARLRRSYSEDHAEVKRAKRKVEVFDSAINEILK
jgi:peptidoglycan hydrolase CwlO-like protein